MSTPTDLLRELFDLRRPTGVGRSMVFTDRGHDDLWRRIHACLNPELAPLVGMAGGVRPAVSTRKPLPVTVAPEAQQLLDQTESQGLLDAYKDWIKRVQELIDTYAPVDYESGADTKPFMIDNTRMWLKVTHSYIKGTIHVISLEVEAAS